MSLFDLIGKRVAITGAAGGIGSAAAWICVELGAEVVLSDRIVPEATASTARSGGRTAQAVALDVADRAAVEAWAAAVGPVDALIDCAAICPFDDWEADAWDSARDEVFSINLGGPLNLVRAFMPRMVARGGGRIALVGSIAGRIGGVQASPHYVMSKGGIHSFVRWAAKRGAPHNVLVNAVAPGVVDTSMTRNQHFDTSDFPLRRKAEPHEIAGPLAFLISPAASYVSGAVLDVNGVMHFS